ncbi:putative reverse transcriptase domain-containing protein, partial [Tanacetum coccineum]
NLGASISVMPLSTYLNLGLGELAHTKLTVELADTTVKYPNGIAENVPVGIGKFVSLVDFIILDMPEDVKVPLILETLFLSLDPLNGDYIELNDLNVPLELRRDQVDDLFLTTQEGKNMLLTRSVEALDQMSPPMLGALKGTDKDEEMARYPDITQKLFGVSSSSEIPIQEVPPLDFQELLACLVRQSGPF